MPLSSMEGGVTTNEFYYLLLVLSAFGTFAAAMSIEAVRYNVWLRRTAGQKPAMSLLATDLAGTV